MSQIGELIQHARQIALQRTNVRPKSAGQELRLLNAAREGNIFEVLQLLEAGMRIDCTDDEGQTALIIAASVGHVSVVKALLEAGADRTHRDEFGFNAYEAAMFNGDYKDTTLPPWDEIGTLLRPRAHVTQEQKDKNVWEPLPGETAEQYAERVGGWQDSAKSMRRILEENFGVSKSESKRLAVFSRSFQERFFIEHLEGMHARGGSRYGAMNYIQRKSDFSEAEIEALVDSIGEWKT